MNDLINKIFNEMYSEKITLQSLVGNIKAENYTSVNFYKENEFIICETNCNLKDGQSALYKYYFQNEVLIKLTQESYGELSIIYDRETELNNFIQKYRNKANQLKPSIA